jgi:N-acetyl-gamma-glutamyl-phosphate reductase
VKTVSILGASGYTGRELARLLAHHPELSLDGFFSAREGEAPEAAELECDRAVEPLDWGRVARSAGVFLCTPHGTSALLARRCLALGAKVVDLSADFRLGTSELYRATYGHDHAAPELLPEAVYGLAEHTRDRVAGARLVANPGCYPTSVLLPLLPLLAAGALAPEAPIVADAKSGTSGAGKTPSARMHFGSVHENFLAYGIGTHRHAPEIALHAGCERIAFVPHLLPVFRGILATIYVTPRAGLGAADLREILAERYRGEPFVRVFERGFPELDRVNRTNECHVAVGEAGPQVVLVSALDNLVKGAAGQALQNMNLALGCEEGAGLQ